MSMAVSPAFMYSSSLYSSSCLRIATRLRTHRACWGRALAAAMVEKQADLYNIQQKFLEIVYGFSGGEVSKAHELTTWTNGWKGLGCIPAGSDAVSIDNRHLEIHKTAGALCKKSTDSFIIHSRYALCFELLAAVNLMVDSGHAC